MIKFQENTQTDVRKEGWTDHHRIFPATNRGLTSTTVVDWHLKVKNKKCLYWSNKKLLHYSQDAKNQLYP